VLAALGFLTPFGPARSPSSASLRWFPLVGGAVGATVGLVWWAASKGWHGQLVPAALAVAADLVLTGMLHVDGLADSADGLLPHLSRDRRLQVMSEPDVGAFGVAATAGVLLLRFAAFDTLRPDIALVVGTWCVSRSLIVIAMLALPYARTSGGLATAFLGDSRVRTAVAASAGIVAGTLVAVWAAGPAAAAGLGAGACAAAATFWLAHRRLGGFTGDVLGAAVVISETAALVVSGAHW
jgi:adenosylcobinamide-GDP ribazoletransferase